MGNNNQSVNLPSEFINEKSILTLSGATFVVFLVCYVINFIFEDTFSYKVYRGIGLVVSLTIAVIITLQDKEKKPVKWFFAFINGCLIFSSVSGLNVMTSGYMNMPSDAAIHSQVGGFDLLNSGNNRYYRAGIISLPRMVNWWPDENLISQNSQYTEKIRQVENENDHLQQQISELKAGVELPAGFSPDSIRILRNQLSAKDEMITGLKNALESNSNDLSNQISLCFGEKQRLTERLSDCSQRFEDCQKNVNSFENRNKDFQNEINSLNERVSQLIRDNRTCQNDLRACLAGVDRNTRQLREKVDSLQRENAVLLKRLK
jgi:peptidoglycan hydrolase CwlO-like protein